MSQEHQLTTFHFCGLEFPAPDELPLPQYGSRQKRIYMSPGLVGGNLVSGLCVREPLGVHPSYGSISFRIAGCTKAQMQAMATAYMDQYAIKLLTFHSPDGDQGFHVLFAENGFKPKLKRRRGYNDPCSYDVDLNLEVLGFA